MAHRTSRADGQISLPFKAGLPRARATVPRRSACKRCGCTAARPCTITLPDDGGEAKCAGGQWHKGFCSRCANALGELVDQGDHK